jgi:hypothetical protein
MTIQPLYRAIGPCFLPSLTNGGLFRPVKMLGFLFTRLQQTVLLLLVFANGA